MTKNRSHATVIALSGRSSTEFRIGRHVASRGEVEAVMEQAKRAAAEIVKAAQNTFQGGSAGYFREPTGIVGGCAESAVEASQ